VVVAEAVAGAQVGRHEEGACPQEKEADLQQDDVAFRHPQKEEASLQEENAAEAEVNLQSFLADAIPQAEAEVEALKPRQAAQDLTRIIAALLPRNNFLGRVLVESLTALVPLIIFFISLQDEHADRCLLCCCSVFGRSFYYISCFFWRLGVFCSFRWWGEIFFTQLV
jgi:hypothetical protein